jgi:hypothetical protein
LSERNNFAAHRIASVDEIPYSGPVWNLTVQDVPTFQTLVGMTHNTVKPIDVMRWLIRLVTPPGGTVLDPFNGSGTTGCAAMYEGCEYVGIEREAEYVAIAQARIAHHEKQSVAKEKPKLREKAVEAPPDFSKLEVPKADAPKATKTLSEADLKRLVKKSLKR